MLRVLLGEAMQQPPRRLLLIVLAQRLGLAEPGLAPEVALGKPLDQPIPLCDCQVGQIQRQIGAGQVVKGLGLVSPWVSVHVTPKRLQRRPVSAVVVVNHASLVVVHSRSHVQQCLQRHVGVDALGLGGHGGAEMQFCFFGPFVHPQHLGLTQLSFRPLCGGTGQSPQSLILRQRPVVIAAQEMHLGHVPPQATRRRSVR